jgi:hypothetical protein
VTFKQRAAFPAGLRSNMATDGGTPSIRQGLEGCIQSRRLHRKKGDCRTAAAAPFTAGDLAGERRLNPPAEGIHTGYHLEIIVEQIFHGPQVSQKLGKSKRQIMPRCVAMTAEETDTVASLNKM